SSSIRIMTPPTRGRLYMPRIPRERRFLSSTTRASCSGWAAGSGTSIRGGSLRAPASRAARVWGGGGSDGDPDVIVLSLGWERHQVPVGGAAQAFAARNVE